MPGEQSARTLIVDDESALTKALCDTLRDHGYQTLGFTTGCAALAALRETTFDLLLADLMMPEMDGIDLLRAALEIDSNLVGIIMTGQGTIDTAVEAMKTGALDYILKPFKLRVVLPVLSRALAVRRLRMENLQLERRVLERTDQLEAVNKELESFSYSVSHDLRAPLRAVGGFANILFEDYSSQMPAEAQRLVNQIATYARQMDQLIEDLLRFSRLGRQPLSMQSVDVCALVGEVLQEFRQEQAHRAIEVKTGNLLDCFADRSLLRQVFMNLLSNAFKFTRRQQHAKIEIGCGQQHGEVIYFIRDNGAGFDMQYAGKLFAVFHRLHRSNDFEGSGVGLSIVQRIVQRHGGRIWAEAAVDQGATFYFTLSESGREKAGTAKD